MIHRTPWLPLLASIMVAMLLAGCGFHLRRSVALPAAMQQRVYLHVNGGGDFPRVLAATLRANGVDVLDASEPGAATLAVPTATFSRRLLTSGGFQQVGEYAVGFNVEFSLVAADGHTLVPMQAIGLSHDFAMNQNGFSSISSETDAIQHALVREMADAVLRRLQARARTPLAPAANAH